MYLRSAKVNNIADICKRLYVKLHHSPPYLYAITSLINGYYYGFWENHAVKQWIFTH